MESDVKFWKDDLMISTNEATHEPMEISQSVDVRKRPHVSLDSEAPQNLNGEMENATCNDLNVGFDSIHFIKLDSVELSKEMRFLTLWDDINNDDWWLIHVVNVKICIGGEASLNFIMGVGIKNFTITNSCILSQVYFI